MKKFKIFATIDCDEFYAEDIDKAEEYFKESISSRYGLDDYTKLVVLEEVVDK